MLTSNKKKTRKELRQFGWIMAGAWTVVGSFFLWKNPAVSPYLYGLAVFFFMGALMAPTWLGPIEWAWMKLAEKLSIVSTTIILTLVYFLAITPIGLIIRNKDLLKMKKAPDKKSFWEPIEPDGPLSRPDKPY
ncbi:MAG: hypothetical protein KTR29_00630 [Rhodothermaceae bacterium]|nr:hypothetical protein [Rhodothermaceae bacterium]